MQIYQFICNSVSVHVEAESLRQAWTAVMVKTLAAASDLDLQEGRVTIEFHSIYEG